MTTEFLTIPELKDELRKLQQAYENDDITGPQFEAGAADLNARITARKLVNAKQRKGKELDAMKKAGELSGLAYANAILAILNAKTEAELNAIQPQKLAA